MAIAYFDSSALVKLLIAEEGSGLTMAVWDQCDLPVSSRLAYPEVRAALAAAGRDGRLSARLLAQAEELWERFWSDVAVLDLSSDVAAVAGDLAARHSLRGADAVHLASAATIADVDAVFVVWDQRLRAGALAEGIAVVSGA
jgi:predicted nucleic acid-binding protein